ARISGQRRYSESAVGLVGIIMLLRDVGFSLAEQRAFMTSRPVALTSGVASRWAHGHAQPGSTSRSPKPRPPDRPSRARSAAETRTPFNAPTSPASRPHVSPANRSTKATREAEGGRRRAAASAYKPRLCDREDTNFTPNPRSNPRRHDWPARGPGRIR